MGAQTLCRWIWPGDTKGVDAGDRGLAYGDGLFETILVNPAGPVLLEAHKTRLLAGAHCLGLPVNESTWQCWLQAAEARGLLEARDGQPFILKLILTRGAGGRGYVPPVLARPLWITSVHAAPPRPASPVATQLCHTRLPDNLPARGFKTLDRLAQVLASRELRRGIYEGLMLDNCSRLVEGTRTNLFAITEKHRIQTPPASSLAVAGVLRQALLRALPGWGWPVTEAPLGMAALRRCRELFLVNSVLGVIPVKSVDCLQLPSSAQADKIRRLSESEFGV
ncbi:aminotransferase class IV [Marinobacteraceae bacterium S3BR75-40.1]